MVEWYYSTLTPITCSLLGKSCNRCSIPSSCTDVCLNMLKLGMLENTGIRCRTKSLGSLLCRARQHPGPCSKVSAPPIEQLVRTGQSFPWKRRHVVFAISVGLCFYFLTIRPILAHGALLKRL